MMTSRYDFMKESEQRDEKTGTCYPDPLTLNYLGFQMSAVPTKDVMTDSKVMFFWQEMYRKYGECAYDDIVLTLNGVPHKNFLKAGDVIYLPEVQDIRRSFNK